METPYRLHYAPDNASLVIRLALLELDQPFETVLVDRRAGAQRSAAYLALNPVGRIPVLVTPHGPMFETAAILLWLADRHGRVLPGADSGARPLALSWLMFLSNTLHAEMRMLFYPDQYTGPDAHACDALRTGLRDSLRRHLALLDRVAGAGHGWLGAATPSALDLYLCACLRWLALYPVGDTSWFALPEHPHLARLAASVEARDSVARAARSEGLGPHPFTTPRLPTPPEGSAT
ncbi:glutathione S-transferase family protein [Sediminimonas sp.]|uniref:glutathione S-transferase family protein n=1 Tax=Sediminimonas sp. TaxID=2823379 RepID=UPI0025EE5784|nr:glutathione S-transferase family protein [Sediminimonas sp.]